MKKLYYFLATVLLGWAYGRQYDFDKALASRPDCENPGNPDDCHDFI